MILIKVTSNKHYANNNIIIIIIIPIIIIGLYKHSYSIQNAQYC